jgi:hypothetical protein
VIRPLLSAAALLALLTPTGLTAAEPAPVPSAAPIQGAADSKPALVIAFSGYQALIDDLDQLGGGNGQQQTGRTIDGILKFMTNNKGLVGLDKTRPWGAAILATKSGGFSALAFVPVTDTQALLDVLGRWIGEPEDIGDGVLEIEIRRAPVYVKEHNGWAFLARSPEELTELPDDPTPWLSGLTDTYDLAISGQPQNLPQELVGLGLIQMQQVVEQGLNRRYQDETDEQLAERRKLARARVEELSQLIKELDEFTLGYAIDAAAKKVILDISLTALPGTKTAEELTPKTYRSQLGGFAVEDAAAMGALVDEGTPEQVADATASIESLVQSLLREIDSVADAEDQAKLRDVANTFAEVLRSTVNSGRIDAAASLVGTGPFTLISGVQAGDQGAVDGFVKTALSALEGEAGVSPIEWNVAEQGGIAFHRFSVELPPKPEPGAGAASRLRLDPNAPPPTREELAAAAQRAALENVRAMFGDQFPVVIGSGNSRLYAAVGDGGLEKLQAAIEASAAAAETEVPGVQVSLRPGLFVAAQAAAHPENLMWAIAATQAGQPGDNDRVKLQVIPLENGSTTRIEAGEGVMSLLGILVVLGQAGGFGGL